MLPKIVVGKNIARKDLCDLIGVLENKIIGYEGSEAKVDDLRNWILSAVSSANRDNKLQIFIWDADLLSPECQAILLKPLEELGGEIKMYLVVGSEHKMLPTIISRCVVEYLDEGDIEAGVFWNEVRKCWASGPAACIAFSDSLDKDQAKAMVREVIFKMKSSLEVEINEKRLKVIENALNCLAELEGTNINQKLSVDSFLIGSWQLIKT